MWHSVLTLCFTFTTLFGPSLCCCSLGTFANLKNSLSHSKPIKSCCQPASCPSADGEQDSSHNEKSKCPCGKTKAIADTLAMSAESASDLGNQLRLLNTVLACGFPVTLFESLTLDIGRYHSSPVVAHLSGRTLLAAYSTLRC